MRRAVGLPSKSSCLDKSNACGRFDVPMCGPSLQSSTAGGVLLVFCAGRACEALRCASAACRCAEALDELKSAA